MPKFKMHCVKWDTRGPIYGPMHGGADLVFVDPPYNYGIDYDGDDTNDYMEASEYWNLMRSVASQAWHFLKPGGVLFWLCPASDGLMTWELLNRRVGHLLYEKPIIWHETFSQYQSKRLTSDYRLLFPIVKAGGAVTFNPDAIREESERQRMGDKRADPRGKVPGHVWKCRRLQGNSKDRVDWHPAQLPPEPLDRIVRGWTNPGDTVVDMFAGSGSMAKAAYLADRNFVGFDASPAYCEKIVGRIASLRAGEIDRRVADNA